MSNIELEPHLKRLYAALLRTGMAKFLLTEEFKLTLLELHADDLWRECVSLAHRNSGVLVLSVAYTGYAKYALGACLDILYRNSPSDLLVFLTEVLNAYARSESKELDHGRIVAALRDDLDYSEREISEFEAALETPSLIPDEGGEALKESNRRPRIFVGSSTEGLDVAKAIQENLDHCAEAVIWSQGVFGLSGGALESLVEACDSFDFAVLVLTPDDLTAKRSTTSNSPRDNVVFELGLFIGALGRKRTYMVHRRDVTIELPTDLAGVTPATFAPHEDGNLVAALGAVSSKIERQIKLEGRRRP